MQADFISSTVRKLNIKTLIWSMLGLFLVVVGIALGARYLYNMALGPFAIERSELFSLQDPAGRFQYFVTIEADDHAYSGYSYVTTSDSGKETTDYYYHVLYLDDKVLIVKSPKDEIENTTKGALVSIPNDVQTEVVADIEAEYPDYKGAFLPYMLDAGNFYTSGFIGLGVGAILGLVSLWGLGLAIYRFANPEAHPTVKALERFGHANQVTGDIDLDMTAEHTRVGKKVHFTRRWLVSTANSLEAAPYRDIIWCYKQVTQHRTNGIPTGKTYAAQIYDRHGKVIIIPGKENDVNEILQNVASFAPGVVAGYSDELFKLWSKDRATFAAEVDKRRGAVR